MTATNEDKYELKCQPTDDEQHINNKQNQVLVSEKKNIAKIQTNVDVKNNTIVLMILSVIFVIILYFGFKFIIKLLGDVDFNKTRFSNLSGIMKGGKKIKLKVL